MSDGGSPVTGYQLERRPANSSRWLKINAGPIKDTTYHCVDLVEGTVYEFRVAAENRVGLGQFLMKSNILLQRNCSGY